MVTHSISRRQVLTGAAVAVPVATVSLLVPTAAYAGDGQLGAQRVVTKYFGILNAGMASTDGDFSALATVYDNNAVLTQSNPAGATKVLQGLDAVMGFYVALWHSFQGIQWSQDHIRNLSEDVVLSYEQAGKPTWTAQGRCAHLFKVRGRRIRTLDWVTYYAGIPA
jgi:SnoaL-like protein